MMLLVGLRTAIRPFKEIYHRKTIFVQVSGLTLVREWPMAITAENSFYILRFDRDACKAEVEEDAEITDEGVEEAFEVVGEVPER